MPSLFVSFLLLLIVSLGVMEFMSGSIIMFFIGRAGANVRSNLERITGTLLESFVASEIFVFG